jgi:hypothetical protein
LNLGTFLGVRTGTLRKERHDIASDKDLCQPLWTNDGQVSCIEKSDDTAKDHIDGGSEESRAKQQQERLDDVWVLGEIRRFVC